MNKEKIYLFRHNSDCIEFNEQSPDIIFRFFVCRVNYPNLSAYLIDDLQ